MKNASNCLIYIVLFTPLLDVIDEGIDSALNSKMKMNSSLSKQVLFKTKAKTALLLSKGEKDEESIFEHRCAIVFENYPIWVPLFDDWLSFLFCANKL